MNDVSARRRQATPIHYVTTIARLLLVISGVLALALGLLPWVGISYRFISLHIVTGLGVTAALVILVVNAWVAGVQRGLVVLTLVWSIVVPLLGYNQTRVLPGSFHWVIEVVHLLVGVGAIALGQVLAARTRSLLQV